MTSKVYIIIGLFISAFLFMSSSFYSSASYGTMSTWDGVIDFNVNSNVYLDFMESTYFDYNESTITPSSRMVVYEGVASNSISFTNARVGSYLVGRIYKRVNVSVDAVDGLTHYYGNVYCEPTIMDGVSVSVERIHDEYGGLVTYDIVVDFTGYKVTSETFYLPLTVTYKVGCFESDTNPYVPPNLNLYHLCIEDYAGEDIVVYSDLRDVPIVEGDLAVQNSTIIEKITSFRNDTINWFTNLRDTIANNFNTLFTNMQSYYNGMVSNLTTWFNTLYEKMDNEHDEVINGYDSATNNDSLTETENTVKNATDQQDAINNDAFGYVDSYTIPSEGISSYATQFLTVFPLVSSMLQSIYVSSGAFGIILSVIFTMTIVCIVIGMFRFYKS